MASSYQQQRVIGLDGREFTAMVKRAELTLGAMDGDTYFPAGAVEVGSVKRGGKSLIVSRWTSFLGRDPWRPWKVYKEVERETPEKVPYPPYVDGVIEAAKELMLDQLDRRDDYGKRYGHSLTDLSHMLDSRSFFGWEDARVWKVAVTGPFTRAQVDHYMIGRRWDPPETVMGLPQATLKGGAKEAQRLAGFALRELAREGKAESSGSYWYWKE